MIDSHCHLADPAFAEDLEEVVARARAAGVTGGLCILALGDAAEAGQAERLRELWPGLRFSVGAHPHMARQFEGRTAGLAPALETALRDTPAVRAVGEIGLDYHYDLSPRAVQRDVFRVQVRLAREAGLPIVVHTREADEDTVAIIEEEGGGAVRGVFHCFSGSSALAGRALELGFLLSFSGIVTFPRAAALREIAAGVAPDRLLVETDCPYLAPVPMRGRRNEPAWVTHTAAAVADMKRLTARELDEQVTANFTGLFGG